MITVYSIVCRIYIVTGSSYLPIVGGHSCRLHVFDIIGCPTNSSLLFLLKAMLAILSQESQEPDLALNPSLKCGVFDRHTSRAEKLIHLFQCTAIGLGDEEPNIQDRNEGNAAEEYESAEVRGVDEGRSGDSD